MKILVVLPTKITHDPLISLAADYLKRVRSPLSAQALFLPPKITTSQEPLRKEIEGKELLAKTDGFVRIALAEGGKVFSSEDFARLLERKQMQTSKLAFLIGGAFGLSTQVIETCDLTLSLSLMTMPHRMAFLMLAEQIYRAGEINFGSPYHK